MHGKIVEKWVGGYVEDIPAELTIECRDLEVKVRRGVTSQEMQQHSQWKDFMFRMVHLTKILESYLGYLSLFAGFQALGPGTDGKVKVTTQSCGVDSGCNWLYLSYKCRPHMN